jgi:hypothetical protein
MRLALPWSRLGLSKVRLCFITVPRTTVVTIPQLLSAVCWQPRITPQEVHLRKFAAVVDAGCMLCGLGRAMRAQAMHEAPAGRAQ